MESVIIHNCLKGEEEMTYNNSVIIIIIIIIIIINVQIMIH